MTTAQKRCSTCKEYKPLEGFNNDSNSKDKKDNRCKTCHKIKEKIRADKLRADPERYKVYLEKQKAKRLRQYNENKQKFNLKSTESHKRLRARNREFVNKIKDVPCTICNTKYPPLCMDFDHLPQYEKKRDISHLVLKAASLERLREEIAKCQIICANCHRLTSFFRDYLRSKTKQRKGNSLLGYEYLVKLKTSTPCTDCNQFYEACEMDFDHVKGVKYMNVGGMIGLRFEKILEELAKCELVCANCHRIRHEKERSLDPTIYPK